MPAKRDPAKVCGAKKRDGTLCQAWAGAGTNHTGIGRCKGHGGASPNHQIAAEKQQAMERMRTYGAPIDTDPQTALLDEVKRTAGHVAWLADRIGDLTDEGPRSGNAKAEHLVVTTIGGPKPHVWIDVYQQERQHLARVCKMALDAGVDERRVRLAEAQGELLAKVINGILNDLELTKEQRAAAPAIVRRQLSLVG